MLKLLMLERLSSRKNRQLQRQLAQMKLAQLEELESRVLLSGTGFNAAPTADFTLLETQENIAVEIDLYDLTHDDETADVDLFFEVGNDLNGTVELLVDGHTARFTPDIHYNGLASFDYSVTDEGLGGGGVPTQVTVDSVNSGATVNTLFDSHGFARIGWEYTPGEDFLMTGLGTVFTQNAGTLAVHVYDAPPVWNGSTYVPVGPVLSTMNLTPVAETAISGTFHTEVPMMAGHTYFIAFEGLDMTLSDTHNLRAAAVFPETDEHLVAWTGPSATPGAYNNQATTNFLSLPILDFLGTSDVTADPITTGPVTIEVQIAAFNSAPVASGALLSMNEDDFIDIDLHTLVEDIESLDTDLIFDLGAASNGTAALLADGHTARFTPDAHYFGAASFDYSVTDTGDALTDSVIADSVNGEAEPRTDLTSIGYSRIGWEYTPDTDYSLTGLGTVFTQAAGDVAVNVYNNTPSDNGTWFEPSVLLATATITPTTLTAVQGNFDEAVDLVAGHTYFIALEGHDFNLSGTHNLTTVTPEAEQIAVWTGTAAPVGEYDTLITPGGYPPQNLVPILNFLGTGTETAAPITTGPVTIQVDVASVNDTPEAFAASVIVTEEGQALITLSGADIETVEGDLVFTITSLPDAGALLNSAGEVVEVGDTFTGPPTLMYKQGLSGDATSTSFGFVVTDNDSASPLTSSEATVSITVTPAVLAGQVTIDGEGVVRIGATEGDDQLVITQSEDGENLRVTLNGVVISNSIALGDVTEIRAWGRAGNDVIEVVALDIDTTLLGGAGNDTLSGSQGSDILLGGDGDDHATGGSGNDMMVGGTGTDRLVGGSGHDILVADEISDALTLNDLRLVIADWEADKTPDDGTLGDELDEALITDNNADKLTGGSGTDWFIISTLDKVTDFTKKNKDGDVISYV